MTEPKLKCPCGKRHGASPRGATSHMPEALIAQAQLYAQMPTLAMARPARDDWVPARLPYGYQPMHLRVPPEMEQELRGRWNLTVTPRAAEHARQMGQSLQAYMGIPQRGQRR